VALVVPYLLACCDAGDAVYEPFCGSGTTIIACEQTRRRCRGVELEPRWVQVAIDRWEAFTGQKARKIGAAVVIPDPDVTTPKARKKR